MTLATQVAEIMAAAERQDDHASTWKHEYAAVLIMRIKELESEHARDIEHSSERENAYERLLNKYAALLKVAREMAGHLLLEDDYARPKGDSLDSRDWVLRRRKLIVAIDELTGANP